MKTLRVLYALLLLGTCSVADAFTVDCNYGMLPYDDIPLNPTVYTHFTITAQERMAWSEWLALFYYSSTGYGESSTWDYPISSLPTNSWDIYYADTSQAGKDVQVEAYSQLRRVYYYDPIRDLIYYQTYPAQEPMECIPAHGVVQLQ